MNRSRPHHQPGTGEPKPLCVLTMWALALALAIQTGQTLAGEVPSELFASVHQAVEGGDYARARSLLEPRVEAGDAQAERISGLICAFAQAGRCTAAEAEALLGEAAEGGDEVAQYALALALARPPSPRREAAMGWLERAARAGYAPAIAELAKIAFASGDSAQYTNILPRLIVAARAGHAASQFLLASAYELGRGVERSEIAALEGYRAAAEQGHTVAQTRLGEFYEQAEDVEDAGEQVLHWYRRAALADAAPAQYRLGMLLMLGERVPRDYYEGIHWLKRAAEAGNARAEEALGRAYRDGIGVQRSPEKALEYFTKAAERGLPIAQFHAGALLTENFYLHHPSRAADYFELAARAGHGPSMLAMGDVYRFGRGRTNSLTNAQFWYSQALKLGDEETAREADERMHATALDSALVGIRMFGVGGNPPEFGEVFDAMIAGQVFINVLYPELNQPIDPDVRAAQAAIDGQDRLYQERMLSDQLTRAAVGAP